MKCGSFTNGMIRESMAVCMGVFHTIVCTPNTYLSPQTEGPHHCVLFMSWKYFIIQLPGIIVKLKSCWLLDIYCNLETWYNRNIPPRIWMQVHQPRISHLPPGCLLILGTIIYIIFLSQLINQAGRGVKWITASHSKELGTDLWCWTPAWLLLPSFLSPMEEDMAMLEGQASFQRVQVPNPPDWPGLVGDRCPIPRLLCKSQRVAPSSN